MVRRLMSAAALAACGLAWRMAPLGLPPFWLRYGGSVRPSIDQQPRDAKLSREIRDRLVQDPSVSRRCISAAMTADSAGAVAPVIEPDGTDGAPAEVQQQRVVMQKVFARMAVVVAAVSTGRPEDVTADYVVILRSASVMTGSGMGRLGCEP